MTDTTPEPVIRLPTVGELSINGASHNLLHHILGKLEHSAWPFPLIPRTLDAVLYVAIRELLRRNGPSILDEHWPKLTRQGCELLDYLRIEQASNRYNPWVAAPKSPQREQAIRDWAASKLPYLANIRLGSAHQINLTRLLWIAMNCSSPVGGLYYPPSAEYLRLLRYNAGLPPVNEQSSRPANQAKRRILY